MTTNKKSLVIKKRKPKAPKFIGVFSFGGIISHIQPYQELEEGIRKMHAFCHANYFNPEEDDARIFEVGKPDYPVHSFDDELAEDADPVAALVAAKEESEAENKTESEKERDAEIEDIDTGAEQDFGQASKEELEEESE